MKKLNSENLIRGYANLLLTVLVLVVFSVAFLPIGTPMASSIAPSPYYRGNADKKQVSLMFNVYENSEVVNSILDVLKENKVKSTFFSYCFISLFSTFSPFASFCLIVEAKKNSIPCSIA